MECGGCGGLTKAIGLSRLIPKFTTLQKSKIHQTYKQNIKHNTITLDKT